MDKELELLIYLITSAQGLMNEPKAYGPLRLIESASKMCEILYEKYPEKQEYKELLECINHDKEICLTDEEAFRIMLQKAVLMSVECI